MLLAWYEAEELHVECVELDSSDTFVYFRPVDNNEVVCQCGKLGATALYVSNAGGRVAKADRALTWQGSARFETTLCTPS